jgi:hypothetical protein
MYICTGVGLAVGGVAVGGYQIGRGVWNTGTSPLRIFSLFPNF